MLAAAAIGVAAAIFIGYVKNVPGLHQILNPPSVTHVVAQPITYPTPTVPIVVRSPPSDVVSVRWRPQDLAPAANAGRICLTDARHGRICASYVVGERPADNLTREIERRGLRVESSG